MKMRLAPYWHDRQRHRRAHAFPRHRGTLDASIAIVGGGLTGCACAYLLAREGVPVVLLEADRLGAGATAAGPGLVREDFDLRFTDAAAAHGLRASRHLWQGIRRSGLDFAAVIRRLRIACDLDPAEIVALPAPSPEAARALRREYDAQRDAGLEPRWMTAAQVNRDAAVAAGGGIRTRGSSLDPYRACLGLARHAAAAGARLFERTAVTRIRARGAGVEIGTEGGTVSASLAIVAGVTDVPDLHPLHRHLDPRQGYALVTEPLPAAVRRQIGGRGLHLRDWRNPPHLVRWLRGDRVLVEGVGHEAVVQRAHDRVIVQHTARLMYETSLLYPPISGVQPEWGWSFAYDGTADGLPYIGRHRNFPRHLFALGLSRHGAGASWLAARLLSREIAGTPEKGDEAFGFARILR